MPLIVDNDKILNDDAIFVVGGGSTNNNKKIEIFGRKNNTHTKKYQKNIGMDMKQICWRWLRQARVVPLLQAGRKRIFSHYHFNGLPNNAQT